MKKQMILLISAVTMVLTLNANTLNPITVKIEKGEKENRGSLKGIWKGSQIDESLFLDAKKSVFPYEY